MVSHHPLVSIGMPVFNGEQYLEETLVSLLTQTFSDFELIISDNASEDRTQEICQTYADKDRRIHYFRNMKNLGAARNYNRVFELSSGKYFKWAAHDDLCAPEFLEICIKALEQDNSIILAYSLTEEIDEHGKIIKNYARKSYLGSSKPHKRFYECICVPNPQVAVFGVIRSDILKKTSLIGNYSSSDRVLMGELTLLGRFYEIPDYLFFKRDHPLQHWKMYPSRQKRQAWYDPAKKTKITFPHWRLLLEHFKSVSRSPLNLYEKALCYFYLFWWIRLQWRNLAKNLILQEKKKRNFRSIPRR